MAYTYDILTHGGLDTETNVVQLSPQLIVAVWPFKWKDSYDRDLHRAVGTIPAPSEVEDPSPRGQAQRDYAAQMQKAAAEDFIQVNGPIFLDQMCVSAQTRSSKASHTSRASLQMIDASESLHLKVGPGDWMMIWMLDDPDAANEIRQKIAKSEPANFWFSGLKFVGRISAVNRAANIAQNSGAINSQFVISGSGFGEFDTAIYFDPSLPLGSDNTPEFFLRLTVGMEHTEALEHLEYAQSAVPFLVNVFVGKGPNPEVNMGMPPDLQRTPNKNFMVPSRISKVLGRVRSDNPVSSVTYSSLLTMWTGIQSFTNPMGNQAWHQFLPDVRARSGAANHWMLETPIYGHFSPMIHPWDGTPIWSILQQFLNGHVNEMYTCLKADVDGAIVPTLVIRQKPFNTDAFSGTVPHSSTVSYRPIYENTTDPVTKLTSRRIVDWQAVLVDKAAWGINHTKFSMLPRWKIDRRLLENVQLTKSEAYRVNYVQVRAVSPINGPIELAYQRARVPPIVDTNDLPRSGLHPWIVTTNTIGSSQQESLEDDNVLWTHLLADQLMGGHLKYSGSITCIGIVDPICEGDNLELDNMLYHIEQVQHVISINPFSGAKTFRTTLALSNGVPLDTAYPVPDLNPNENPDTAVGGGWKNMSLDYKVPTKE